MSIQNKRIIRSLAAVLFLTAVLAVFPAMQSPSFADTKGWETVRATSGFVGSCDVKTTAVKKIGSYYIKCVEDPVKENFTYYYSNKKTSGYKKFLKYSDNYDYYGGYFDIAVKGNSYICLIGDKLYMGTFGNSGKELLCDLQDYIDPLGKIDVINGAYGDHIFITLEYRGAYVPDLILDFNVSTKTLTTLMTGYLISAQRDQYMLLENTFTFDGEDYDYPDNPLTSIYKYNNGALTKVANLGKNINAWEAGFYGKKVYFAVTSWKKNRAYKVLKCCSLAGKNVKTLGKLKANTTYFGMPIEKITTKYCILLKNEEAFYKYTFKTKKLKKITKKQYKKEMADLYNTAK